MVPQPDLNNRSSFCINAFSFVNFAALFFFGLFSQVSNVVVALFLIRSVGKVGTAFQVIIDTAAIGKVGLRQIFLSRLRTPYLQLAVFRGLCLDLIPVDTEQL